MVKLQLKLLESLPKEQIDDLVTQAETASGGNVRPMFPDTKDAELATFYVIEAANPAAAERTIRTLKGMKGVDIVARPATRTHKS